MNKLRFLFNKIRKSFFYLSYKLKRTIRIFFKIDQKIYICNKKIYLPPGHLLSLYNDSHQDYDQFLPKIIENFEENISILDIGANVGDTLFRLISSNSKLKYYCIEADDYFFEYLKKNKELLDTDLQNKIYLIKELVGEKLTGNLSKSSTGTKTLIESNTGIKTKKLDQIIKENDIKNIKLIKVDVDGYDHNVLFSAIEELIKNKPDLFFEYYILNESTHKEYIRLLEKLFEIGYNKWVVLDNYGSIILDTSDFKKIITKIQSANEDKTVFDIYCKLS